MAAGVPVSHGNLSNLKDILSTYNKITHLCFNSCISNFNYYNMTKEEEECIHRCSGKFVNGNNKIMSTFMEVQSKRQLALIEEAEQKEKRRLEGQATGDAPQLPGPASASQILFNNPVTNPSISANTEPSTPNTPT